MKKEHTENEVPKKGSQKKQEKKEKRKSKKLRRVILILIALLLLGFVIGKFGFGFGDGFGLFDGENASQSETTSELATSVKNMVAVSVVENDYLYDNQKLGLDQLMSKLKVLDDICVEITSDNAALKAYNNLIDELKDSEIEYVEKSGK